MDTTEPSNAVRFHDVTPILRVSELEASFRYYVDVLGFELDWREGRFGCVRRNGVAIMLSEGSQGCGGTWMWISVSDSDALHRELLARGARIRHPPTDFPWGSRELHVFDPDGHVLRFGSESSPGAEPGAWLDEQGARWLPRSDGSWARADDEDVPQPGS